MRERVQFRLTAHVGVLKIERVLRPVGRFIERFRILVHANGKRAARDDGALDATRQRFPAAAGVPAMLIRCISSASFVPLPTLTLKARCNSADTRAGRAHWRGIVHVCPAQRSNVESLEHIGPAVAQLEHARTDSGLVQLLCDVVLPETRSHP